MKKRLIGRRNLIAVVFSLPPHLCLSRFLASHDSRPCSPQFSYNSADPSGTQITSNDPKINRYRFTVYQAAHDVCLRSEWSHQVQLWIQDDQVTGVDGGRKPPPPEGLPKIYLKDDRPAVPLSLFYVSLS